MSERHGFTLIELLVVVTIIVVLLALLVPAMDRAIYQAELAVCGAQLKAMATAATATAIERQRYFPDLSQILVQTSSPHKLVVSYGTDIRPIMREYLGASLNKMLTDPFVKAKAVDLDGALTTSNVYGSYWLFMGWQYSGTHQGGPGMRRLGDRWTWGDRKYDVLACDFNVVLSPTNQWSSHPDADGVLNLLGVQDKTSSGTAADEVDSPAALPWLEFTTVSWVAATDNRGLVDMNFARTDGSVQRYNAVKKHSNQTGEVDDRMAQVSNLSINDGPPSSMGIVPRDAGQ